MFFDVDITDDVKGTIAGGLAKNDTFLRHIGQLYYEQKLLDAVQELWPYNTNPIVPRTNLQDTMLTRNITLNTNTGGPLGDYDPFVKYVYLTEDLADGIFAWHAIGIDMSSDFNVGYRAAAKHLEDGGVALNGYGDGTANPATWVLPPKGFVSTTTSTSSATPTASSV